MKMKIPKDWIERKAKEELASGAECTACNPDVAQHLMLPDTREVECFKHYCRTCKAMEFVPRSPNAPTPRCCGKHMAFLGIVTAIPGRDVSLKKS
jgi:hypothetical protein